MKINQNVPRILPEPTTAEAQPNTSIAREELQALQIAGDEAEGGPPPQGGLSPQNAPWPLDVIGDIAIDGFRVMENVYRETVRKATIDGLRSRAAAAGLTQAEANKLTNSLQSLSETDFRREVSLLNERARLSQLGSCIAHLPGIEPSADRKS